VDARSGQAQGRAARRFVTRPTDSIAEPHFFPPPQSSSTSRCAATLAGFFDLSNAASGRMCAGPMASRAPSFLSANCGVGTGAQMIGSESQYLHRRQSRLMRRAPRACGEGARKNIEMEIIFYVALGLGAISIVAVAWALFIGWDEPD
jgi:hypothetical protein